MSAPTFQTVVSDSSTGSAGSFLQKVTAGYNGDTVWTTATYPVTAGGAGTVLRSDGTNWVNSTFTIPDTFTQGSVLYASSASVLAGLAKNTTATRYLSNTGASNNPAWAQVDLTNGVSGVLPVANGGTGGTDASPDIKDTVHLTAQGADIGSTNFASSSTAGTYRVSAYVFDSTADLAAGAVTVNILYTDASGAQTRSLTPCALTVLGTHVDDVVTLQLASGSVAYSTTHSGLLGSAKYDLHIVIERLS